MTRRFDVVVSVLRHPALRRMAGAFLAFSIGEWATWVAIVIYAYSRGGAAEAGLIAFVQLLPSIIIAPLAGSLGDRFPRARVLFAGYVVQSGAMAAAAVALWADMPAPVIYALATVTATAITITRPAQAALLPDVCVSVDQLTASNVTAGTIEGLGTLLGPAFAGVLTAIGGPALVFAASSLGLLLAALSVVPVLRAPRTTIGDAEGDQLGEPLLRTLSRGLAEIVSDARLRALAAIFACTSLLMGALDIFYAVLAFDVLHLEDSGVGYLGAATGVGMLVGGMLAVALVGRARLGLPILAASVVLGGALALVGLTSTLALVILLLVLAGTGSVFVYIGVQTMTQRIAGAAVRNRVFGVYEALMQGSVAIGALAVPVLIGLAGTAGAFVIAGIVLPLVALFAGRSLLAADRSVVLRVEELGLLRANPLFAPLSAPILESLAASLRRESYPAGQLVLRQGDRGDRYFLLANGAVRIEIDGRLVQTLGPGDGFGEIALLRDVPRTASVIAIDDVEVYSLEREPFLAALTGVPDSRAAAEAVVEQRLATGA
ncbi:MAG TPA: MFS transporter [Candidatus Limnocylindrales bacterium]|nr:MFS transporter [Candidatus Limnocylindrales bacterium]